MAAQRRAATDALSSPCEQVCAKRSMSRPWRCCQPASPASRLLMWLGLLLAAGVALRMHARVAAACATFCGRHFLVGTQAMGDNYTALAIVLGVVLVLACHLVLRRFPTQARHNDPPLVRWATRGAALLAACLVAVYGVQVLSYVLRLDRVTGLAPCTRYSRRVDTVGAVAAGFPAAWYAPLPDPIALGPASQDRVTGPSVMSPASGRLSHTWATQRANASLARPPMAAFTYSQAQPDLLAALPNAGAAPTALAMHPAVSAAATWQGQVPDWTGHTCVLLVLGTGWPRDVTSAVRDTAQAYATRHGYSLVVDQATSLVKTQGQYPAWNTSLVATPLETAWQQLRRDNPKMAKLALAHWLLSGEAPVSESGGRTCDLVLLLDRDAVVTGQDTPVAQLMAAAPSALLHAAEDPMPGFAFNSGVMLLARHPWTVDLLLQAWEDDDFSLRTAFPTWMDQPLLNKHAHPANHPTRVAVHPPCALNSWEAGFMGGFRWQAGDFIAHLYASEYPAERSSRVLAYAQWVLGKAWTLPLYTYVT